MAFGVEELRVLRRALALALKPGPTPAEDVRDCLRLAESLDEAMREGARLRAFLLADLARYRAALPGAAAGYLTLLEEALGAGYRPQADDLAALRALRGNPAASVLLGRCRMLAEQDARAPLAHGPARGALPTVPAARNRLTALPGGLKGAGAEPAAAKERDPAKKPETKPVRKPAAPKPSPAPAEPKPARPIPTPGEVFPRRKPTQPPASGQRRHLAAG
ncbi:hypothetical protein [Streptomyces sp. NBC_00588]|uniref:hypothetical protein n=1 Tax=Streptomyces sp. NBC_00588 TaxID=2975784 RepID=UPI002E8190E5|nr:hypothetical protein [Streptomyces sp. NBC_00588]WUB41596.1 hypothetical protein OHN38_22100 [Streptomyces sp. NBC_00588]